jgi:hypothetical protein
VRTPIEFGHKVFLAESAQGLITQYEVLKGNPVDEIHVTPSLHQFVGAALLRDKAVEKRVDNSLFLRRHGRTILRREIATCISAAAIDLVQRQAATRRQDRRSVMVRGWLAPRSRWGGLHALA